MSSRTPILVVCFVFPPCKGIGGRRWAKFAKGLATVGRSVHVVHAACAQDHKGSLWTADVQHPNIITHPLPQRYPTVLFKRPLVNLYEKLTYRFWSRVLPLITKGNWLDRSALWREQLVTTCDELIRRHGIRHVIVSGAPFHLLVHALELKRKNPGLVLIGDLRDPWTWVDAYGLGGLSDGRAAEEKAMERNVMATYDHVLAPDRGMIDHLLATYGSRGARFSHIPHPVDPDDLEPLEVLPRDQCFRIVYAGSLYSTGDFNAYLTEVLASFHALRERSAEVAERTRFDLFVLGEDIGAFAERVEKAGFGRHIHFHAPVPPRQLYAEIRRADLVMVYTPDNKKDILTTKFAELFLLGTPLLVVGSAGRVVEAVVEAGAGDAVRLDELSRELPAFVLRERKMKKPSGPGPQAVLLGSVCDSLEALLAD